MDGYKRWVTAGYKFPTSFYLILIHNPMLDLYLSLLLLGRHIKDIIKYTYSWLA